MKKIKILFFIKDSVASKEESELARSIKEKVCFRNIKFYDPNSSLEDCDFVLGEIPEKYSKVPIYGEKKKEIEKEKIEKPAPSLQIWQPNV